MFYFGERPWDRLGTKLSQPAKIEEALVEGGLDWTVSMAPLALMHERESATPQTRVASANRLRSDENLSNRGVQLFGAGIIVSPDEATGLGLGTQKGLEHHIRDCFNGRDFIYAPRGVKVIDAFGPAANELRARYPAGCGGGRAL